MKKAYINGRKVRTRETLHETLAEQLAFPSYYGGNLDALYDILTSAAEPIEIEMAYETDLASNLGTYYSQFLRVLEDASEENDGLTVCHVTGPSYSRTLENFLRRRKR